MGTINVLSLSYGKDSLACLGACEKLGYPIDRIVHAEIWATDTIPADLPPMVEFKSKADAIIKERYGLEVEHVCAIAKDGTKQTYEKLFYHVPKRRERERERDGRPLGFPQVKGNWCTSNLKKSVLRFPNLNRSRELVYAAQGTVKDQSKDFQERQSQRGARLSRSKQCVFR